MMAQQRGRRLGYGRGELAEVVLHEDLAKSYAKQMRRVMLRRPRRSEPHLNGYLRVWIYLCTLVYRLFNDRRLEGRDLPAEDVLRDALDLCIHRHLRKFLTFADDQNRRDRYDRFARLDGAQIETLTATLAAACARDWTHDWIDEQRAWGTLGGRPPGRTGRALADSPSVHAALRDVAHLSIREQAKVTQISESSVRRAWRRMSEIADEDDEVQDSAPHNDGVWWEEDSCDQDSAEQEESCVTDRADEQHDAGCAAVAKVSTDVQTGPSSRRAG